MLIASWNVNSIRARGEHVRRWLRSTNVDVLLLQELKGTEFPAALFEELGYHSAAVTQKAYNGVAILSRTPVEIISKTLLGDELDSHARFLEVMIEGIRLVNIYLPNGNPIGTEKFDYKLAWMDRLALQMNAWLKSGVPTIVGGDFNVIPEDMDCHKPASWIHDALFQPEPRARFRAMLALSYVDAFRSLHPGAGGQFTFGTTSAGHLNTTVASASTTFSLLRMLLNGCRNAKSTRGREPRTSHRITRLS
jgi:exodeoxyribonuclease-3